MASPVRSTPDKVEGQCRSLPGEVAAGLLAAESAKRPVSLALPAKALDRCFPQLVPIISRTAKFHAEVALGFAACPLAGCCVME